MALVEAMTKKIKSQGCEEQHDPFIPNPREKSKDLTASLELRLTRVEKGIGTVDAHMENLNQWVEGLEADIAETHEEVREALTKLGESNLVDLQALRDELFAKVARSREVTFLGVDEHFAGKDLHPPLQSHSIPQIAISPLENIPKVIDEEREDKHLIMRPNDFRKSYGV
ncbi:hypothetical protein M9H77_06888 [Catharanthus roseus]|uniref:Uncharacterized protein n=1 Tax=Catharanthus roseus TaxID=4058 RepID=A0ACC0BTD9_CATRO|nr:hypothetical protein M9H77_06888 [Catharanthus roseus]